jgi:ATP-dependent DNA helicase RecQ
VPDALVVGQKILSSVMRQQQRFGGEYTALVLRGSQDQRILANGHQKLSTHGLLKHESQRAVRNWIEQLVGQGYLNKVGEYGVLEVTPLGWKLLRGESTPRLLKPIDADKEPTERRSKSTKSVEADSWEGVDRGLFQALKQLRRERADELGVPSYIVFNDASLREMARCRPTTLAEFRKIRGVGDKKTEDFGHEFTQFIANYNT